MLYAEWVYQHFYEYLDRPERGRVIRQTGYLFLYENPESTFRSQPELRVVQAEWIRAQQRVQMQRDLGVEVELLSPSCVTSRWPHLLEERISGATFRQQDGTLLVEPIVDEPLEAAKALGARVLLRTEAIGARHRAGRIASVEIPDASLHADWVVNATNAWAPRVSATLGGMLLPVVPLKRYLYRYAFSSHPTNLSLGRLTTLPMTIYGAGPGRGAYSRPDGTAMLMGWARDYTAEPAFTDEEQDEIRAGYCHTDAGGLRNLAVDIRQQIAEFAPGLVASGGVVRTTSGFYAVTPDGMPLIGTDARLDNLVHAVGFCGHGIMRAPLTALQVEAIICGDTTLGEPGERLVRLPAPFSGHAIDQANFDPKRDFAANLVSESVAL
jgi:sarcosine oxidase subunit beta